MASSSKMTKVKRNRKVVTSGKARKRNIKKNGTTPAFPIHIEAEK
jgi:hypothetical protein